MDGGLIFYADVVELSMSIQAAFSDASGLFGSINRGIVSTSWTQTQYTQEPGISLTVETLYRGPGYPSTDETNYIISIPGLGIDYTHTAAQTASASGKIHLRKFGVLGSSLSEWMIVYDGIDLIAEGVVVKSWGAGFHRKLVFDVPLCTPSGIWLVGMPPLITTVGSISPFPAFGYANTECSSDYDERSNTSATGGFRFQMDGVWHELPIAFVDLPEPADPPGGCPIALAKPTISGSLSNSISINAGSYVQCETGSTIDFECNPCPAGWEMSRPARYQATLHYHRDGVYGSAAQLFADLEKDINFLNWKPDYSALVYRHAQPGSFKNGAANCCTVNRPNAGTTECDGGLDDTTTYSIRVHPNWSRFMDVIADGGWAETFLEPFRNARTYAHSFWNSSAQESVVPKITIVDPGFCGLGGGGAPQGPTEDCGTIISALSKWRYSQKSANFGSVDVQDARIGTLWHSDDAVVYNNTIANPHWGSAYWFPPNTEDSDGDLIPDRQYEWKIYDQPVDVAYYLATATQWQYHPALPPGKQVKTRNTILDAPLDFSPYSSRIKNEIFGFPGSWIGINRFKARKIEPLASVQMDSQVWNSVADCTLAFNDFAHEATATPDTGKTSFSFKFAMGDFEKPPYFYPSIARSVVVDWTEADPDIESVTVYLESPYSSLMQVTNAPGEYTFPVNQSEPDYIGNWAQDRSAGYLADLGVDDFGVDMNESFENSYGHSFDAMQDPDLVNTFHLKQGHSGMFLRFDVTLKVEKPFTFEMPIFKAAGASVEQRARVVPMDRSSNAVIFPEGQGILSNMWQWWDYDLRRPRTNPGEKPLIWAWEYRPTYFDDKFNQGMFWLNHKPTGAEIVSAAFDDYHPREIGLTNSDPINDVLETLTSGTRVVHMQYKDASVSNVAGFVALINENSELPPLNWLATRKRAADYTFENEFEQKSYALAIKNRYYVNGSQPLHLWKPATEPTEQVTSKSTLYTAIGWSVTGHNMLTNQDEPPYDLRMNKKRVAKAMPWHPYYSQVQGTPPGGARHMCPTPHGVLFLLLEKKT